MGGEDLGFLAEFAGVGRQPRLRQHVAPLPRLHVHVVDVRVDRDRQVRRQRPRRGGPDQRVGAVERAAGHLEPNRDGGVLATLVDVVVHARLVIRQRRLLVPAVRQHPIALVDQPLVAQLLECPHDRLHEVEIEGLVVVVEVDPARLAGDVVTPLVRVAQHRRVAGVVELRETHLFDLRLVGDAELPLRLELGGQPVGVPAEAAVDLLAAHGLVPRHEVLDVAGQQVAVVRQAVGEGRTVVEDELRRIVAVRDAGAEGVVVVPVLQDVGFQRREVRRAACRLRIGGHGRASSPVPMSLAVRSGGQLSFRHGDDDAPVRGRRGTTPLAHVCAPLILWL